MLCVFEYDSLVVSVGVCGGFCIYSAYIGIKEQIPIDSVLIGKLVVRIMDPLQMLLVLNNPLNELSLPTIQE